MEALIRVITGAAEGDPGMVRRGSRTTQQREHRRDRGERPAQQLSPRAPSGQRPGQAIKSPIIHPTLLLTWDSRSTGSGYLGSPVIAACRR